MRKDIDWDFSQVEKNFAGSMLLSYFWAAFSAGSPPIEGFFIKALRPALRQIMDDETLKGHVNCMLAQEAHHAAAHALFNTRLEQLGYDIPAAQIKFKEILAKLTKGLGRVDALAELLVDPDRRTQWDDAFSTARAVEVETGQAAASYFYMDLPWPLDDRDIIVTVTHKRHATKPETYLEFHSFPTLLPKLDGVVRVQEVSEIWHLKQIEEEAQIELLAHADSGGPMPAWLINRLTLDAPSMQFKNCGRCWRISPKEPEAFQILVFQHRARPNNY